MRGLQDLVARYAQKVDAYEPWTALAGGVLGSNAAAFYAMHSYIENAGLAAMAVMGGAAGTFAGYFAPTLAPFLVVALPGIAIGYATRKTDAASKTENSCKRDNTKWQKETLLK